MLNFQPTESPGFLVGRVAHALNLGVQEFLDEGDIPVSVEELRILLSVGHCRVEQLLDVPGRCLAGIAKDRNGLLLPTFELGTFLPFK